MAKLLDLSLMKIFGILFVVLIHSTHAYTGEYAFTSVVNSVFFANVTVFIDGFVMPLFFFASGAVYYYTKIQYHKYPTLANLLNKKIRRLIIPYLLTGALFLLPIWFLINLVNKDYFSLLFNNIILGLNPGHLWFLLALFNVFVLFYLIEKVIDKIPFKFITNLKIPILLSIAGVCFILGINRYTSHIFQIYTTLEFILMFTIGYAYMDKKQQIDTILKPSYPLAIITLMTSLLLFIGYNMMGTNEFVAFELLKISFYKLLLPLSMIIFILSLSGILLNRYPDILNNKFISILDKYNFQIYLFHDPIIFILLAYLYSANIEPLLLVTICFTVSLIASIILAASLNKILSTSLAKILNVTN